MDKGVARELARIGLPVNVYTEWYWKIDLHNLFHFLSLRMDAHAQQEIRDYATAMFKLVQPIVPIAAEAFLDYNLRRNAPDAAGNRSDSIRTAHQFAKQARDCGVGREEKKTGTLKAEYCH